MYKIINLSIAGDLVSQSPQIGSWFQLEENYNLKDKYIAQAVSIPSDRVLVSIDIVVKECDLACLNPLRSGLGFNHGR